MTILVFMFAILAGGMLGAIVVYVLSEDKEDDDDKNKK